MKRSLLLKSSVIVSAFAATLFSHGTASALSYNITGLGTLGGGVSYGVGMARSRVTHM